MNECGASVELYLQGRSKVFEEKPVQFQFVHCKSHMDWPGIEPMPLK
jgi:hypothetical protein